MVVPSKFTNFFWGYWNLILMIADNHLHACSIHAAKGWKGCKVRSPRAANLNFVLFADESTNRCRSGHTLHALILWIIMACSSLALVNGDFPPPRHPPWPYSPPTPPCAQGTACDKAATGVAIYIVVIVLVFPIYTILALCSMTRRLKTGTGKARRWCLWLLLRSFSWRRQDRWICQGAQRT